MARSARIVMPDIPYHVTQRGNRNQQVFFSDHDRREYLRLIREHAESAGVRIWAYCLMTNHVHFVAVPEHENSLARCFAEAHRRYTSCVNLRNDWRGYLWQGRFSSFPMDENYLIAAVRYVENNPVTAGLATKAEDHPWSSAAAHVLGRPDPLLSPCYLTEQINDWSEFLRGGTEDEVASSLALHTNTGRPLGDGLFTLTLEEWAGRPLRPHKRGPKHQPAVAE